MPDVEGSDRLGREERGRAVDHPGPAIGTRCKENHVQVILTRVDCSTTKLNVKT